MRPHSDWTNALRPAGEAGPELTLAENGSTDYRIVVPARRTTQEAIAADELGRWLHEMTGATFTMIPENPSFAPTGKEISVGRTRLLEQADIARRTVDLGDEGYGVGVDGETLYLFGGKRRGPIYAVYALLEEDLGCRWYARQTATIPHRSKLTFRPVPRTSVPALERRDPYYSDAHDVHWSLRNRTSSHRAPVPTAWGGHPRFPYHFVHTYNILIPPEQYFEKHPDWFSEINGERRDRQLCATHPEVIRVMTEKVLERLRGCPDCWYVDVSPNDWRDYCECSRCAALDEKEDSHAASLLTLVNAVADAVAEQRPDVKVTTLAYLGTFMPPKTIRPRDNVQIVLCTDSHAWDYLFLDVSQTRTFQAALKAWSDIDANIMIWDYAIDFFRYMRPTPNLEVVANNIRIFVDHGAVGVMEQGSHGGNYGVDRCRLRSWLWAKQLWDPSRETEPLLRDFYYGFYGQAAEPLYGYDQMLRAAYRRAATEWEHRHPEPVTPDKREYEEVFYPHVVDFDDAFIDKAAGLFNEAESLANGDEELTRRIEYAKLPVLYLQAERGPREDHTAYLVMLNEFERIARRENAVFTRDAYSGPDLDRRLTLWRAVALIDPDTVGFRELSNAWKFKPDPDNVGIEQRWFDPDLDDSDWGTVRSDLGHRGWESQGYAEYEKGYGWYRQTFEVPDNVMELPNLRLFFPAVDEQAEVWINGTKALEHTTETVGLSKDFLWNRPFVFDPKPYLKPGRANQITVRVHNALHVGGIYKPVRLVWGEPVEDLRALDDFLRRQQEAREGKPKTGSN